MLRGLPKFIIIAERKARRLELMSSTNQKLIKNIMY